MPPYRRYAVAATGALGTAGPLALFAVHDGDPIVRFVTIALPLGLELGLFGFGLWLLRSRTPADVVLTTAAAAVGGALLFAAISVWVSTVQALGAATVPRTAVGHLNTAAFGMGIAAVVGYLYAQLQARTAELRRQRGQLQKQNDRLDEFTSVVAHDLRNPLNVAQLRVELAQETHEETEHIDTVEENLRRAEALISEMLTLAQQGRVIEERAPVSVTTVARQAWETVAAPDAELLVEADVTVSGDRNRLEQVFENLFRNAVEHGGESVTVRVGPHGDGFYVEDDGAGFGDADVEQLLEMGYTTETGGTGYGLAIVGAIVDAHGWQIRPVANTDGGARFEVETDGRDPEADTGERVDPVARRDRVVD